MSRTEGQLSRSLPLQIWGHQDTNNIFEERVVVLELQEVMDQHVAR